MQLTQDWTVIASVEGGEILAMDTGTVIRVSYPEHIDIEGIKELLIGLDIEFGDEVTLEPGPSESETIAVFSHDKPIKLFETIREAKQVLSRDLDDQGISEITRLKWFMEAMRAELTIGSLICDHDDFDNASPVFEEGYRQAKAMLEYYKTALKEADRQFESMIKQAKYLRHQVLREYYDAMPQHLQDTKLVSWDSELGWIVEASY